MNLKLFLLFIGYALGLSFALARRGLRRRDEFSSTNVTSVSRPTRILIVGATGGTGRQLVAQALERGYIVTVLVRNPAKLPIDHPQLKVLRGDVLDYQFVEAAMAGQEAVVCALGHKRYFSPNRILSTGTGNLLRAMLACGVKRLVCETSLGIGDSAGRMGLYYTFFVIPVILPLYFWDKTRQEQLIAASSVEWVIVRPGVLTNGPKRGAWRDGFRVGHFIWTRRISRTDVAEFMLNQLADNRYLRAAVGVT